MAVLFVPEAALFGDLFKTVNWTLFEPFPRLWWHHYIQLRYSALYLNIALSNSICVCATANTPALKEKY